MINAWYYHKIGDKYVREKIADRQSVYLKYPENEEDRYTLIDNVKSASELREMIDENSRGTILFIHLGEYVLTKLTLF